ncbi:hypothetical protein KTQ94_01170 [Prevotella stercorea]|uniref:hypothetical protein n=1 Tax=Leyella stercorea TaxID=363265 RepID=UPI001C2C8D4A|nr:hypothetical protein [Leyella stercorea]MBU9897322.1 hypothetical protein [Leyella stercorea]MBU9946468.1 hypothetical protein [Leyella stercorea]
MELKIYDKRNRLRTTLVPDSSSTHHEEVGGDDYLSVSLDSQECVTLELNDWTVWEGRKFWCVETYTPKQTGRRKWTYSVKLYGAASLIKQALMLNTEDSPVFSYTATAREHVALVVKNLNRWMGGITDWKVGKVEATGNIVVDYSEGLYGNDALKKIADEAGTEWWIEGMTVNVCRCERGDEVTLGYGNGLLSIERDSADNVKFFTRLFPIGSSRNIDAEKYGSSRLLLPSRATYVERNTELGIVEHFEQTAFQEIYPRRTGKVSSVRKETKKGDDGKPFDIYYFTDGEMNFDPNEYEIGGLVKRVTFQTGQLAGLGNDEDGEHYFEVNYNSATREFELITIWPYDDDTQVPGGVLEPKAEDTYILWNVRMPDEYYPIAEEEYATAVEKYMDEHCLDRSVYKCSTDYVALKKRGVVPCMGQRVRLESDRFFASGYRESRITVVDQKLERPTEADIEISDVLSQTTQSRMADEIENVRSEVKANTVELPDVIRSWDTTLPTDNNLFSARRSEQEFLSRKRNDRTKGRITFEQGVVFGEEENGFVDGKGNAELLTAVVKELLSSGDYSGGGLTDRGWKLGMDEDRLSHLIVDKLTVRQVMNVFELLINKVRSVGGQICVSAANGKIKAVEEQGDYYLISFEQENMFVRHDLVRCQTFTGTSQKAYWVEVAGIANSGILVEKSEFETAQPEEGDECVLMGNTETANRQNLVLISASEDGHPRVDVLDGMNAKNFDHALRARLGNLNDIKDDRFPLDNQPKGNGLYADNVYLRGTFLLSTGEDIKTKLEITEGKVQSAIDSVRNDFLSEKGYLNNPTFTSGLEKWNSENETVFFLVGNKWIWANGNVLSKKGDGASVVTDMGRTVVRIRNKYILQKHGNLRYVPTFPTNDEGQKEALPVYLTFFYRCAKVGTLKVRFENVDKTGFANFNSMEISEEIAETEGYVQYTGNGLWNGTGDFRLEFDGDIYMYMLVLSTDKYEALTHRYRTLFEQSERLVKISAAVFDKDENMLEETGLITTSKVSGLYAIDGDGNLKSFVGAGQDGVKIKAANIQLEGIVTANGNFKILEDGSIEAKNGKFTGEINASNGNIGNLVISSDNLHYGNIDDWTTEEQKTLISASQIRLQNYLYDENTAKWTFHQLFLGINADPNDDDAATFMYLNKNMQQGKDIASLFRPAFRIESKVASSPRVSILSSGSIVVNEGGVLQAGKIKDVSAELPLVQIYSIDWMDGPLQLLKNTSGSNRTVFLDIKNDLLYWMFGSSTYDYAFVLTLVGHKSNNADIDIASGGIALIGASKITIKANSVVKLLIVRNGNSAPYEDNFYCLYNNNL